MLRLLQGIISSEGSGLGGRCEPGGGLLQVTLQMLFSCSVLASCMRLTEHPQDEVSNTAKATIKALAIPGAFQYQGGVQQLPVPTNKKHLAFTGVVCCSGQLSCITCLYT